MSSRGNDSNFNRLMVDDEAIYLMARGLQP